MCGIAGLIDPHHAGTAIVQSMLERLRHRGPDGENVVELSGHATFGHRRLAIVGLGETGRQPMRHGTLVITYNGEIYNHAELRSRLEREGLCRTWHGSSDTEVLLAAIAAWGLETTLRRADGMFAFALWDEGDASLTLVRDRMGEKPLYFGWLGDAFAFASELTAFASLPGWHPRLDQGVAVDFLRHGFVSGSPSLVKGIYRLPPGTIMRLSPADMTTRPVDAAALDRMQRTYWRLSDVATEEAPSPEPIVRPAEALESLLGQAVRSRMTADVPVGAFLSGGVDSSLVTALMQASSPVQVHTFCIGFTDARFDESAHARAVARHLGTEHTEFRVRAQDALEVACELPLLLDEPIADASQIPTLLLARMARSKVTVALSGDGADELFAGYGRYRAIVDMWGQVGGLPVRPRRWMTGALHGFAGKSGVGGRAARWASRAEAVSLGTMRKAFVGADTRFHLKGDAGRSSTVRGLSPQRQVMLADQQDFLPDDILQKVDRATMRYGLESRTPFLDHRVVSFSWKLPDQALPLNAPSKPLLRAILRRYVPDDLIDRPKQGFDVPMCDWLRGPLSAWTNAAIGAPCLDAIEGVDAQHVRRMWRDHSTGRADFSRELWPVALLTAWMQAHGVDP